MAGARHEDPSYADDELAIEAPGADEVGIVAWPNIWRDRMAKRVGDSEHLARIVLWTTLFGLFTVTFTITVLAVSIPTMATDLGSTESLLTWAITGPLLAFAVFGPSAGKLADIVGARRVYLWGLVGAAFFAGCTALAWSGAALVAFRILGATAGAATGPASMALINKAFPRERRVQAMGYWSLVMAGGPVLGVIVGGPVVEAFSWRVIFIAQVPLTLIGVLVAYLILPETPRRLDTRFDVAGSVLLASAVGAFLVALNQGPDQGWTSPIVLAGIVAAPMLLVCFVAVERRTPAPLLPLAYLRRRNFSFPIVTQFFTNFAYMGGFIITPFLLHDLYGYGEARTGLLMIPRPLTFAVAGPVAGYLAVRLGERTMGVFGAAVLVGSMGVFALTSPERSDLVVVAALALSGVGLGSSSPAMAASIANSVDERDLGIAGAAQQMMAQVGVVAGIQIMLTVQEARESAGALASYHLAYLVGAIAAGLAVVTSLFVRSTPRAGVAGRERGAPQGAPDEVLEPA
jgi:EmrB/QacA subfamily drug resistance transporter